MNKYLVTVNVGSLNIGTVTLYKRTEPFCMYLSTTDIVNLAKCIADGSVVLGAAGDNDVLMNALDTTLMDDFAVAALDIAKENTSQLSDITPKAW